MRALTPPPARRMPSPLKSPLPLRVGHPSAVSPSPLTLPFDCAVQHGFDAFEWFPDKRPDGVGWVMADMTPPLRQYLRGRARDAGISLSVHAPIHAEPVRANGNKDLDE